MIENRNICVRTAGEYTYVLTRSTATADESTPIPVYGILIKGSDEQEEIPDLFTTVNSAKAFYKLIVEERLFPVHLYDVAEDYISENKNL